MLLDAIQRSYDIMEKRGWDTIYWAVDLHGVCLVSNYEQGGYTWINDTAARALRMIAAQPENKIILWSSAHEEEQPTIIEFFKSHGIDVLAFNANPLEKNTKTGCFDKKFYFSVLLDDKAGFDPDKDWDEIISFYYKRELK
jgi:hypothetical protein